MKSVISFMLCFLWIVLMIQPVGSEQAYKETSLRNTGWIQGHVKHSSTDLQVPALEVNRDADICGKKTRTIEAVSIGSDRSLRNAVVYLQDISSGKAFTLPAAPPSLIQKGCTFSPHVQVLPPLSSLKIVNDDQILHSIHAYQFPLESKFVIYPNSISYPANTLFNIAMVAQRKESFQQLGQPGIVKFVCDAGHYWMTAYAVVLPHPYAVVVDQEGTFQLRDVPPGNYVLKCWHEYFGIQEKKITVKENQPAVVDFEFTESL
jgi:hypothetical protein